MIAVHPTAPAAKVKRRSGISHVIFDFDGTVSWIRHGWPELMAGLFLAHIPPSGTPGEASSLHDLLLDDILSLNGKSSIFQMERCGERVAQTGGPKLDPKEMLAQYLGALDATIRERKQRIQQGLAQRDQFVVHGARAFLEKLRRRSLILVLLSGTAQEQVREEAALLDVEHFFGSHIYGSTADLQNSSKRAVLERLMAQERISGLHLLSFGDGPVETDLAKKAGGLAVGVASDEDENGSGKLHPQKASQLRAAGADLLIPDYRDPDRLLETLLGS